MKFSTTRKVQVTNQSYVASDISGDTYSYNRDVLDSSNNVITGLSVVGATKLVPTAFLGSEALRGQYIANEDGCHLLLLEED